MIKLVKYPGKFWGVHGYMTKEQVNMFLNLPLNSFLQGGDLKKCPAMCFVEFWTYNEARILDEVLKVYPDIQL